MSLIYHVTTAAQWADALKNGAYETSSLAHEGFIHCSTGNQVGGVLERYFAGRHDLVSLVIEPGLLKSKLQYDRSDLMNEDFPHIYGPVNLEAVICAEEILSPPGP